MHNMFHSCFPPPATVNHLLFAVYCLLLDIYYTCSEHSLRCASELLDIFLKAFSCCAYGAHDVQAFNVLTNQFLALKTTRSEKLVNQSFFHITEEFRLLSAFLCTLYTIVCSDWRANSKNFNHSDQPSCSVIFFCKCPIKWIDEQSLFRA